MSAYTERFESLTSKILSQDTADHVLRLCWIQLAYRTSPSTNSNSRAVWWPLRSCTSSYIGCCRGHGVELASIGGWDRWWLRGCKQKIFSINFSLTFCNFSPFKFDVIVGDLLALFTHREPLYRGAVRLRQLSQPVSTVNTSVLGLIGVFS